MKKQLFYRGSPVSLASYPEQFAAVEWVRWIRVIEPLESTTPENVLAILKKRCPTTWIACYKGGEVIRVPVADLSFQLNDSSLIEFRRRE